MKHTPEPTHILRHNDDTKLTAKRQPNNTFLVEQESLGVIRSMTLTVSEIGDLFNHVHTHQKPTKRMPRSRFQVHMAHDEFVRQCPECGVAEDISLSYLHYTPELDEDELNCHHIQRCPSCKIYYDMVLDHDGEDTEDGGTEYSVELINYRIARDLFDPVNRTP